MHKLFLLLVFICISNANEIKFDIYKKGTLDFKNKKYLMSEKLDGIRGIWDGNSLKTRNGNEISTPQEWVDDFPPFVLDGELWIDYNSFEKTSSIVRNSNSSLKEWQQVTYNIFDAPNICNECPLDERMKLLEKYLKNNQSKYIKIIPQIPIDNENDLEKYFNQIIAKNGEGLIIRDNKNPTIAYKYKKYQDSECKVVGYQDGNGKYKGLVGAIICQANINNKETIFKIGTGLKDKDRVNPPPLNSIITYRHNGITKNGIPRFPVFMRIRN